MKRGVEIPKTLTVGSKIEGKEVVSPALAMHCPNKPPNQLYRLYF